MQVWIEERYKKNIGYSFEAGVKNISPNHL
jgi:hypothetical protein